MAPETLFACDLATLGPIDLIAVTTATARDTYHQLMARHPLGDPPLCGDHPARTTERELRDGPVTLKPPGKLKAAGPVALWAVYLREVAPPAGVEGVDWLLLTNVATTTTLAAAQERVSWYGARWVIEVFYRTLKTGCQIEERQLGFLARLENCLAIDLVVAWRIYYLTLLGRMEPDAPCTLFFQEPEWQALYSWYHHTTLLPDEPPTLREATR